MTTAPPPEARTRILDAAETIVRARGVPALTLEAAARQAGISKGGLLYHFAGKEALLTAMLARLAANISAEFERRLAAQPTGPGRATRALLAWSFDPVPGDAENQARAAAGFLAAFHHDPALLGPVRAVCAQMRAALAADGLRPGVAQAVMCVGDGLFMARVFGLYSLTEAEMAEMRAALERLLETAP